MRRRGRVLGAAVALGALLAGAAPTADAQESYVRISGEGSSWSANAIDSMRRNVAQFGITVDYNPSGSTSGRKNFLEGIVDFAASDIPFQFEPEDGSPPERPERGSYVYIPVTAGGTAFMYNLQINGQRVTNLRLSGENVAKIFTGEITAWNDPAIAADNPGLQLPGRAIVPVVRSDGSGSTAQFTAWMIARHPNIWNTYCSRVGRSQCGQTSFYPTIAGMIAQPGDPGVAGYVQQGFAEGAIGYVNYSYALNAEFPVVKVLNAAGYYTEPTPENVAVSLLKARINNDESNPAVYLTQDLSGVYADTDPRNYQLSSYSYFILPIKESERFTTAKGRTLGAFAYYAMCQAQQTSASLGYSPIPINLVEASFEQIRKIPGVEVQSIGIRECNNPTFSPDGTNVLAANAPQPKACDRQGTAQCPDGTGGLRNVPTAVLPGAQGGGGGATGGAATGGGATGGGATGGGATGGAQAGSTGGGATGGGASGGGATGGGASGGAQAGSTGGGTAGGGTATGGTAGATTSDADAGAATTGGADGTGTSGLSTVDAASGDGAVVGDEFCDPDTGECFADPALAGGGGDGLVVTGQPTVAGPIQTTVLDQNPGWSGTQILVLLVVVLTLALIFGPAWAWRKWSRPTATPG